MITPKAIANVSRIGELSTAPNSAWANAAAGRAPSTVEVLEVEEATVAEGGLQMSDEQRGK